MGDGRFDAAKLAESVEKNTRANVLFDMDAVARDAGAMINAVMLGAIAAAGRLPIPVEAFEGAIRAGKSSAANLRGFKAGFEAALRGAREIGFTVLSISISLIAVFIPILLMGGIVGRLFREFAVTLSVAILVSLSSEKHPAPRRFLR